MENSEIPTIIANNLFDFKDSYMWKYLTSNSLKYLLGSLVLIASFYWSLFLVINIQLLKPLYDIIFDRKGRHPQKTPHSKTVTTTKNIKMKTSSLPYALTEGQIIGALCLMILLWPH